MSLSKKSSKSTLRLTTEDISACLDQKNAIIGVLQNEVEELRTNEEKYDRAKDELSRTRAKYEALVRDNDISRENNHERLEMSAKGVFELKVQIQHLEGELRMRGMALKQAKFGTQQLAEHQNRREDEASDLEIKLQELRSLSEIRKMEEQRIRLQLVQLRDQVQRQRKENEAIRRQTESVGQRAHKTQSYIRNLSREEANLNESLTRVQDENNSLDTAISELECLITNTQGEVGAADKECQQLKFLIASKELEKKRLQNEIKEKVKALSGEREKGKVLGDQLQLKRAEGSRLDSQVGEAGEEINFILSKNGEIADVNEQLRADLVVCQRHLENVARVNKAVEAQLQQLQECSMIAIRKLQQPMRGQTLTNKWSCSSRMTGCQTGDAQVFRERKC